MTVMLFGQRWRGQPVNEMTSQDPTYCRWLINVPAFQDKHPRAYALVRAAVIRQLQVEADRDLS
jgi:hypothetical protein